VRLKGRPDVGALSEAEVDILRQIYERYRYRNRWNLRDETHETLPEWVDPGESSREITIETVLEVLGKSESEIDEIREVAREAAHFRSVFGR